MSHFREYPKFFGKRYGQKYFSNTFKVQLHFTCCSQADLQPTMIPLQRWVHINNITRIEEENLFLLNIPKIPIFKLIQTTESCKNFCSCARISFPLTIKIPFKVLLQVSFYWKVLLSVPSTSILFPIESKINCFLPLHNSWSCLIG